jgi:two-component sensor histidine kinase
MISTDEHQVLEAENLALRRLLAKAGVDAAAQEVARKLQRVLLEEMHHRVKNIMATVQAITSLSLQAALSVGDAQKAIESRLHALGRVHDLLLDTNWAATKIGAIVGAAVEPFNALANKRFIVNAADIDVKPEAVLPIGLVLNELCTNAVKYGALSNPAGRVKIDASAVGDSFVLTWEEHGGPPVEKPTRRSFGSTLIEHAFVAQLQGRASLVFDPSGVRYRLATALSSLQPQISN